MRRGGEEKKVLMSESGPWEAQGMGQDGVGAVPCFVLTKQNQKCCYQNFEEHFDMYPGAIGLNLPPTSEVGDRGSKRAENRSPEHLPPTVTSVNHTEQGVCTQSIFYYQ